MGPEQSNVILGSVQCGQGILRELSQAECAHLHLGPEIGKNISASWDVIGMSEDLDILVKTFQSFPRVLKPTWLVVVMVSCRCKIIPEN